MREFKKIITFFFLVCSCLVLNRKQICYRLPDVYIGYWQCSESYTEGSFQWQIGCALALWWLSQMWIAGHIWFPKCERLAKAER